MNVRYSPRALADLADIVTYLDERSPVAARAVRRAIETSIAVLADFPELATLTDVPDVREMTIVRYPYKVYYTAEDSEVWILHIRDARRKPWTDEAGA
jgi:plasmid stabilization system protein ParE